MTEWIIKAVFIDGNGNESGATYFDDVIFNSKDAVIEYISQDELIAESCVIDSKLEPDLLGLVFSDLIPIKLAELPYATKGAN